MSEHDDFEDQMMSPMPTDILTLDSALVASQDRLDDMMQEWHAYTHEMFAPYPISYFQDSLPEVLRRVYGFSFSELNQYDAEQRIISQGNIFPKGMDFFMSRDSMVRFSSNEILAPNGDALNIYENYPGVIINWDSHNPSIIPFYGKGTFNATCKAKSGMSSLAIIKLFKQGLYQKINYLQE